MVVVVGFFSEEVLLVVLVLPRWASTMALVSWRVVCGRISKSIS